MDPPRLRRLKAVVEKIEKKKAENREKLKECKYFVFPGKGSIFFYFYFFILSQQSGKWTIPLGCKRRLYKKIGTRKTMRRSKEILIKHCSCIELTLILMKRS